VTVYDRAAMELLIRRVGPDRVLFATEASGPGPETLPGVAPSCSVARFPA